MAGRGLDEWAEGLLMGEGNSDSEKDGAENKGSQRFKLTTSKERRKDVKEATWPPQQKFLIFIVVS